MGRPRKPSRRFHITLAIPDADLLAAHAARQGKSPTAVAGLLLAQTLRITNSMGEQAPVDQPAESSRSRPPRWEWAMGDLLADRRWWTRWLPRLNELTGRPLAAYASRASVLDDRGYVDLLASLFPPVRHGDRVVAEWHSPDYPDQAHHGAGSTRPAVWEAVLRHVAEALCALERTGVAGADPYLRIRTEDEITGGWLRVLRLLIGEEASALPVYPP